MSLIKWPFVRKTYNGIPNPRYVSDIQAANENTLDGLAALAGLGASDFAIISGLELVAGTPSQYNPGVIFFNGSFYVVQTAFDENLYVQPMPTDIMPVAFEGDGVSRYIYTEYYAQSTNVSGGSTPQFTGNMNQYRLGNKFLRDRVLSILTIVAGLGTAATANLGTGTGQVLVAEQTYTRAQVNALLLMKGPSVIGSLVTVYSPSGAFAASFDGTGLGIVYPWVDVATAEQWALCNGSNGTPNLGGVSDVGIGVFTNPDTTTKNFTNNLAGGETDHALTIGEMPSHNHASGTAIRKGGTPGSGGLSSSDANTGAYTANEMTAAVGGGAVHNNMPPFRAMYKIMRIS